MTDIEMERSRKSWEEDISGEDEDIISRAGEYFFNP
jgi:hypothetical protein